MVWSYPSPTKRASLGGWTTLERNIRMYLRNGIASSSGITFTRDDLPIGSKSRNTNGLNTCASITEPRISGRNVLVGYSGIDHFSIISLSGRVVAVLTVKDGVGIMDSETSRLSGWFCYRAFGAQKILKEGRFLLHQAAGNGESSLLQEPFCG